MIRYYSYYGDGQSREKRDYTLAATNKMDYMVTAIEKSGYDVEIVSMSPSSNRCARGYVYKKDNDSSVRMFFSLNNSIRLLHPLNRLIMKIQLLWCLLHQSKDSQILVYHSLGYLRLIAFARKLRNFNLILEVEEIYGDVLNDEKTVNRELRYFKLADKYIFPTQLLDEKINCNHKPSVIIHGTYQVEEDRKIDVFQNKDNEKKIIHCVYAGTLDPRKGGAAAAAAVQFLPENYHVHILGFGSDREVNDMKRLVEDLNGKSEAKVSYDGVLSGEDYIRFIQSCDIGLSTQNPDAAFNATSFPSKILSYMANGLRVVSIRIPAIECSAVGDSLYYYEKQTPEEIAKAILAVDMNDDYDGRSLISRLDEDFRENIKKLLMEIA